MITIESMESNITIEEENIRRKLKKNNMAMVNDVAITMSLIEMHGLLMDKYIEDQSDQTKRFMSTIHGSLINMVRKHKELIDVIKQNDIPMDREAYKYSDATLLYTQLDQSQRIIKLINDYFES